MSIGYSPIASSYNELYREEQLAKVEAVLKHFKPDRRDLLLDLGCGTGLASSGFKSRKVGLDNSMALLRLAPGLERVCGTAERLPFKTKCFDVVICLTAIHNFQEFKAALGEMQRVSNRQVVSVLRRSEKYREISNTIREMLVIQHEIETERDTIFITQVATR